jgi:flagellin-like protein
MEEEELVYNKIRKLRKNVKAISPVLSTLLMIAVAVAASLVTYAWVMGYLNFTTSKVGKSILIQSIAKSGTGSNDLVIYVQNVGDGTIKFNTQSSLYVNGVLITSNGDPAMDGNPLTAGSTTSWTVPNYFINFQPTDYPMTLTIKIVASDGTFSEKSETFG